MSANNSIFKIGANLALACILSGAIIAATYAVTAPIAAQEAVKMKEAALQELVPQANKFKPIPEKAGWYLAQKDGQLLAVIAPAHGQGYGGEIKMLVAISPTFQALDYRILKHNETPGLGDKATKPAFREQFAGKAVEELVVVKTPSKNNIQALTGATITSRAVTNSFKTALKEAKEYFAQHPEQISKK